MINKIWDIICENKEDFELLERIELSKIAIKFTYQNIKTKEQIEVITIKGKVKELRIKG